MSISDHLTNVLLLRTEDFSYASYELLLKPRVACYFYELRVTSGILKMKSRFTSCELHLRVTSYKWHFENEITIYELRVTFNTSKLRIE